ncbi:MAG TPA: S1 RNA-binding domain-containing protein, partial [Aggregicoccus sp.]|nr:S1 RNA-binding domain-containing protein [Aggregicoccus sp.]
MLGIPAGRGGEREERGGRGERGGGKSEARPRSEGQPSQGPREERKPREGGGRPGGGEKRAQGPLVVIKRASGAVETRGAEATAGEQQAPSEPSAAVEPQQAAEATAPVAPRPPRPPSPLFEEVPETQSFAEMFETSAKEGGLPARRSVRVGEKVTGTIFQLGADTAFVSLGGGKSEAQIELRELKDDEGILRFGVGDKLEAHVVEMGARGIVLTRTLTKGSASIAMLAEARASGMPVEGLVLSVNKGGLEVAIGDVRAFCPVSQIDVRFVEKPDQFV